MTPIVITQGNVPPPNYEEATKLPNFKPPEYRAVAEPSSVVTVPSQIEAVTAPMPIANAQSEAKQVV